MAEGEGGGIFVSYRRKESRHFAGRLSDSLAYRFGEGQVFIDVDAIEPGVDFAEEISRAVAVCKVLLAIIGPTWLTAADQQGRRRLDDPDDIVRLELEAALARDVRVIPILVEGAVMPTRQDLPESLVGLARRRALPIRYDSFRYDAERLVTAIERVLPTPGTVAVSTVPGARPAGNAVGEVAQKGSGPTRTDVAHAKRLLADAERIANSITTEYTRAEALSGIAQALAATDPDRAARLLTDAERIANSITDGHSKAAALSRIAQALAATDPDRAELIANSITAGSWKARALSGIAQALAATDPDRAELIANSITAGSSKAWALSGIAQALAATDPDRAARLLTDAERIANSITDESSKAAALNRIAQALAATDPDRAELIANSITAGSSKAAALNRIAQALAATDPDRAARLLTRRTHRQLHHRRVLEGSGAGSHRAGAGSHRPRPRRTTSPTPSPPGPGRHGR